MKKIFLLGLLATICSCVYSQNVYDKIFITEYVMGGWGQRAIEIGNNTGSPVELNRLRIRIYFNGNPIPQATHLLSVAESGGSTLASGEVFVLYTLTNVKLNLTAETMPNTKPSNRASEPKHLAYSGNDVVELQYYVDATTGWKTTDIFGKKEEVLAEKDSWKAGKLKERDISLSRKATVTSGVQVNPEDFNKILLKEWEANYKNEIPSSGIFETLGKHSFSAL